MADFLSPVYYAMPINMNRRDRGDASQFIDRQQNSMRLHINQGCRAFSAERKIPAVGALFRQPSSGV